MLHVRDVMHDVGFEFSTCLKLLKNESASLLHER